MTTTRTGNFSVGFRRGGSQWQQDIAQLIAWARAAEFAHIDVRPPLDNVQALHGAGFGIGSVDLPEWRTMLSSDAAKRADAVALNTQFIKDAAALGARAFFVVMLPEDPAKPRPENFRNMVDSYAKLMPVLEESGSCIVIEGWPGPGALCCTPETYRAFFEEVPSVANCVNYDPSHLVRMGIDPIHFLHEFAARVGHVHAKDTELLGERLYNLGTEQPATFAPGIGFGGGHWRYTIPGHGCVRWCRVFEILRDAGYQGLVSIELEDGNFNGTEAGEQAGFIHSRNYLASC